MKKLNQTIFLTLAFSISFGQFPVPTDSLYTLIKFNSIHRGTVDWEKVDKIFYEQIKTAKSNADTMICFVTVLKNLNDVHSQIYLNNQYYGHYPGFEDSVLTWLKPLNYKAISVTNEIHSEIIGKEIGFIKIPSFEVFDTKQINIFAQSFADTIHNLSKHCKKGYIID
ncbi:MAG: hypothetical protein GC171_06245 [Terrimonas sp.]|nr:hypothetical protein [Terrimonas sp.]